jgi:hypothetical protein
MNRIEPSVPVRDVPDGPPPVLKTWPRVYTAVLIYLVLLVTFLYVFTRLFSLTQ